MQDFAAKETTNHRPFVDGAAHTANSTPTAAVCLGAIWAVLCISIVHYHELDMPCPPVH